MDTPQQVEWAIYRIAPDGTRERHSEGAQTVFSLDRARKILKVLGPEWSIWHATTGRRPGSD